MRADRLLAILMYLQTHGRTTVQTLAQEFEVSRRTLLRDIYALRVAGFPLDTTPGPSGGCALPEHFRSRLTTLKPDELAALMLSSVHQPLKELGLSAPLRAAQLKLAASSAQELQRSHLRLASRILIDAEPWPQRTQQGDSLSRLFSACMDDRWVEAEFIRPFGIVTRHRIAPHALVSKAATWYCIWADESAKLRVDRVDRVRAVVIDDTTFTRSSGFDLQSFWEHWLKQRMRLDPSYQVDLRLRADALEHVRAMLRPTVVNLDDETNTPAGWRRASLAFSYFDEARTKLLPLGGAVEVLRPQALRASMEDFAVQIASVYQ